MLSLPELSWVHWTACERTWLLQCQRLLCEMRDENAKCLPAAVLEPRDTYEVNMLMSLIMGHLSMRKSDEPLPPLGEQLLQQYNSMAMDGWLYTTRMLGLIMADHIR